MQRHVRRTLLVIAVLSVFVIPVAVSAGDGFTDVDDTNVFHADIDWLADAEVTKGCNPPVNDMYCPGSVVTRGQMAAFPHRAIGQQVAHNRQYALPHPLPQLALMCRYGPVGFQPDTLGGNAGLLDAGPPELGRRAAGLEATPVHQPRCCHCSRRRGRVFLEQRRDERISGSGDRGGDLTADEHATF